jgi:hypothetical protein
MGGFWNGLWLTAAFVSECVALVALAMGGCLSGAVPLQLVAAPRAPVRHRGLAALVKVAVLGSGVLALHLTGHPEAAAVLAVVSLLGAVVPTRLLPQVSGPGGR